MLIAIIASLSVLKFVLIPIVQWQDTKVTKIAQLQKQLTKGQDLLQHQTELTQQLGQLMAKTNLVLSSVAANEKSAADYQIHTQQMLDKLLEKHGLSVRTMDWLNPVNNGFLEQQRIEIAFSGRVKHLIEFIRDVEQLTPKLAVVELRDNISKMWPEDHKLGNFMGKIVLMGWRNTSTETHGKNHV